MSGENKFFFESDPEDQDGGSFTPEDQANIFGSIVSEIGLKSDIDSMAPMSAVPDKVEMKTKTDNLILLEYGIVQNNYTIHLTPIHQRRNLSDNNKLNDAIKTIVLLMNKMVPFDLKVSIHLPQEDWEIKALSFVIEGGADAWNFNVADFEETIIPEIFDKISKICMVL